MFRSRKAKLRLFLRLMHHAPQAETGDADTLAGFEAHQHGPLHRVASGGAGRRNILVAFPSDDSAPAC
jgi:hypothetical protein